MHGVFDWLDATVATVPFRNLRDVFKTGILFGEHRCKNNVSTWGDRRYRKVSATVIPALVAARENAGAVDATEPEVLAYLELMKQRPSSNPRSARARAIAAVRADRPDVHAAAVLCVWARLPMFLHTVYGNRAHVLYRIVENDANHNDEFLGTSDRADKYDGRSARYAEVEDVTDYLAEKLCEDPAGWPAVCAAIDDIGSDDLGESDSGDGSE